MSRARATGLALVNWKGVFFERYQLDRHVTALEGANGAGKTTVMIAAYVVLLPDMTRLRFTNLGESANSAGDRGIWGRLGEPERPSYSVIDFEFADGQRALAGVQLARKAEPGVELVPFLLTNVDASLRMSDLLLLTRDGSDQVPSLEEFSAHAESRGARVEVFQSAKEYFSALFERGITPLRLNSDEERNKLNEMLRTSMTGGISRALTSELRGFLLREETGLSDTLRRMRENLDACRRTRTEVTEARALEQEISSIYDAGQAMFAAAFGSAKKRAEELSARAHEAQAAYDGAESALHQLGALLTEASGREQAHAERRQQAQLEHATSVERAQRAERARGLHEKLSALSAERQQREVAATNVRSERERINQRRKELKAQRDRLREGYERAARGLSDSERGLDELHRTAADQRRARRLLEEARELLARAELAPEECEAQKLAAREALERLDRERARADRLREQAALRARDADAALAALQVIAPSAMREEAHDRARQELARLGKLEFLAAEQRELAAAYDEASTLARRQGAARLRARELGLSLTGGSKELAERLSAVEEALRKAEQSVQREAARADDARQGLERVRSEGAELENQSLSYDDVLARRRHLASTAGSDPQNREELTALHRELFANRERLRQRFSELSAERDVVSRSRSTLESGGGALDPELVMLCEELEGELLATRFDDVDVKEAALLEAELGPLARAIVVDDAQRAARELLKSKHGNDVVHLVEEGADPRSRLEPARVDGPFALIRESYGVRVARLPERPTLGVRARKRRGEELAARSREIDAELDTLDESLRKSEAALRECEELAARAHLLELSDPRARLVELRDEAARLAGEAEAHEREVQAARSQATEARLTRDALVALLGDGFLLDPPDHAARVEELGMNLERAKRARSELERVETARKTLTLLLDALLDNGNESSEPALLERSGSERDRLFRALETLTELERLRHVLGFEDAEVALQERTALLPALTAQHESAHQAVEGAETALGEADAEWETIALNVAEAEAARAAVEAHAARLQTELNELDVSVEAGARAREAAAHWANELASLEREERSFAAESAVRAERKLQAETRLGERREALAVLLSEVSPARDTFAALCEAAERAQLPLTGVPSEAALSTRPSAALAADAASKLDLLWGRLSTARGAAELVQKLHAEVETSSGAGDSLYLKVWLLVRDWLARRVPAQVADVADPLSALTRLRDQLSVLEHRLTRQEQDLRGASEDVARGIEVGLRRAKGQVRRLNQSLEGVAFGSIHGVRVQLRRVERMDQVLTALRDGAAQELLFQSNLPIEEALNEIFKRFAGGKTGGQRLLDYREYLELSVEIRRQTGTEWELANPSRLSTGEAIGVGATLMMVILTEWERDANLLRGKRASGTLRFLFLDEANRLSQDNLGVLFELCKHLDLQLLIAAPEVARADGNTTYRLVRRLTDEGREEVMVTGRRVTTSNTPEIPANAVAELAPVPEPEQQLSLLADPQN